MDKELTIAHLESVKQQMVLEEKYESAEAVMLAVRHLEDSEFYSDEWLDKILPPQSWEDKAQLLWSLWRWNVSQRKFEPAAIVGCFKRAYGKRADEAIKLFTDLLTDYVKGIEAQAER